MTMMLRFVVAALAVLPLAANAIPLTSIRSIDGVDRPNDDHGAAEELLMRMMPANMTYPDGKGAVLWDNTNPRTISNILMKETTPVPNDRNLLDMVWQWGQFLDHDIDLTEGGPAFGNMTVTIPNDPNDPFIAANCNEIDMHRSEYRLGVNDEREQVNHITSFIDGSVVYGSSRHRANMLRKMNSCEMLTSSHGRLLPKNTFGLSNAGDAAGTATEFFVAGDIRANEQVGLTAMHTLFVREHNHLCYSINEAWPNSTADEQYELARKIVGAQIQAITYKEFLPAILGPMAPSLMGYNGYDDSVTPSIANEFSTAAYRFGHTMLSGTFSLANQAGIYGDPIELKDSFFNATFFDNDFLLVDHLLGGLQETIAQEIDPIVNDAVRNFLFGAPNGPDSCLDLVTLNIQRGRDHGIPAYNDLRQMMGLGRYTSFAEMTHDVTRQAQLLAAYPNGVDYVDAWVGMLSEDHVEGASVGELLGHMLRDQFERLMVGDPFFFKIDNDLYDPVLIANVTDIEKVTLQSIIFRNTVIDHDPTKSAFVKGLGPVVEPQWPMTAHRTMDGSDRDDNLGEAHSLLMRMAPPEMMSYTDGKGQMYDGPNPRTISNEVFSQSSSVVNDRGMLDMMWQWGQFLDHDIDLTEPNTDSGIAVINIPNVASDPFIQGNCDQINMTRSEKMDDTFLARQQPNFITSFVDASNVYGSDDARAWALRESFGGRLKMSANGLLPKNVDGLTNAPDNTAGFFLAGDIRANEQSGLTAMHTLFVREHNRLADDIAAFYPHRTNDEIYQLARKIVSGEMQAITYNEFLPTLLGPMAPQMSTYFGYNATVDPSIANEFSTFAYRVGHTMLSGNITLANSQGPFGSVALRDLFFDTTPFDEDHFFMDHILGGLMEQHCQEVDAFVVDDVRNHLFGDANGPGSCLDLVSLNIQRGRDHGLPLYNEMRVMMGLSNYSHFENITSDTGVQTALASVYSTVEDIDAWVGGLAEDHVVDASVGELVGTIIKDQFERLMYGDPFFYLGDQDVWDQELMLNIMNLQEVTLQLIMKRNTNIDHDPSVSAFVTDPPPVLSNFPLTSNRTIDGSDRGDGKGEAGIPLLRMNTADMTYTDGNEAMMTGPSARLVSNTLCNQSDANGDHYDLLNPKGLLDMVWQWGQFLDHDIGLTDAAGDFGSMTIQLPSGDYFLDQNCPGIDFHRSQFVYDGSRREQVNLITSFIDGSAVYGSDEARAAVLRTGSKGEMNTSMNGLNLPYNLGGEDNAGGNQSTSFLAGDVRANEQIGLIAMHTLFVREHNRLADLIADHYQTADDEHIYQLARKLVSAEIQAVTYKEFLPALLGPLAPALPTSWAYDSAYDPSLANEFSTAIYRFGHSMISPQLQMSFDGLTAMSNMSLADSFFNPDIYLSNPYTTDMLLGGLMLQEAQKVDTKIIDNLRMFLFEAPSANGCLDLAALNIQRGRDHGIPLYNDLRVHMGLTKKMAFDEITFDNNVQTQLAAVYTSVDDVEAWVGALAENHIIGGNVGELLAHVMRDQFERLMFGDPFFWLGDTDLQDAELKQFIMDIDSITLAKIIDLNTILDRDPSFSAFIKNEGGQADDFPLTSNRTIDGSDRPDGKGEAETPLMRMSYDKMTYTDGMGDMMTGAPNPRMITSTLMTQDPAVSMENDRFLTDMVWQWGQFVDHDIGLTEGAGDANGWANISIPNGDFFDTEGCPQIAFPRSHFVSITNREQINAITSFIDASMVYGSDEVRQDELRTKTNGELKSSGNGLSLPYNLNQLPNAGGDSKELFIAGDIRVNEQQGLIAIHTLFLREHNRLAGRILQHYPSASDEEVYQLARKLVGAEIQKISYSEWLPALLGPEAPSLDRTTFKYDETVDPRIANEFSTGIFRFGHSMIGTTVPFSYHENPAYLTSEHLNSIFFDNDRWADPYGAYATDGFLCGLTMTKAQEIDVHIVEDLRDFLFGGDAGNTACLDLSALNIQRGRDHGIPLYNDMREAVGLPRKTSIADITSDATLATNLGAIYSNDVDKVEMWVGGLAEDHVTGASVGELMAHVMKDQFTRLAKGDPFFYLGDEDVFNPEVRSYIIDIEDVTLGHIIDYNSVVVRTPEVSAFIGQ